MVRWASFAFLAGVVLNPANAWAAECYDVSRAEPRTLTGTLDFVNFPGPPNFKDVQGGDAPDPTYVLRLADPICLTGKDSIDSTNHFTSVEVLETDTTAGQLKKLVHRQVILQLTDPTAAESDRDHEPLVAKVTSVQLTEPVQPGAIVEEGTAESTVRAFYDALRVGKGETASLMVAPEKRSIPAFTPAALSKFYGTLQESIRLIDLNQTGPDTFAVHYRYVASSRTCDGRAVITTSARTDTHYIENIRALDGC